MKQVVRQLERVRRTARLLLGVQSASRWLAALVLTAAVCAAVDYLLRLPGWLRLAVDAAVVVMALRWLTRGWLSVPRFRPQLGDLALRAEQLFPQLSGLLASGVEFATAPKRPFVSPRTEALTQLAMEQTHEQARQVSMSKLIDPRRPVRAMLLAALALGLGTVAACAAPHHARLAAERWLMPLGDAQWPRRTSIESRVAQTLAPIDQPLRLSADIERGYRPQMRTWTWYRWTGADGTPGGGEWQSMLMNEQQSGSKANRFDSIVDLPQLAIGKTGIEFYFAAGDDATQPQRMQLVQRPALVSAVMDVQPPAYTSGLISPQQIDFGQQSGQIATAVVQSGSQVTWRLKSNKPVPAAQLTRQNLLPGLPPQLSADIEQPGERQVQVSFVLDRSVQTHVVLTDEHGLSNLSQRLYRLTAMKDKPPTATIVLPLADESVLATATIDVVGMAEDDVAVESLALEAEMPQRSVSADVITTQRTLQDVSGRHRRLTAEHMLELTPLKLEVDDQVTLHAVARDVFVLDGVRHDPVRSAPRRLRVIDATQLAAQIRSELAAVRRQAARLSSRQRQVMESRAQQASEEQHRITQRLKAQASLLQVLRERMDRNRLDDQTLDDVVGQATELVGGAKSASGDARQNLQEAQHNRQTASESLQQARAAQDKVNEQLTRLVELLDQGQDALTLQLQLREMAQMQEQLMQETRGMLPKTAGRSMDQLDEAQRRDLKQLSGRQQNLSQRAGALTQQMQATAEAMQRGETAEQELATAEALAQAAATAQRKGLPHTMEQAADAAESNRLGDAGKMQNESMQVIEQMLEQIGGQEQRRREILRRRLEQLAQAIEKLVKRQDAHLQLLDQVVSLVGLDQTLATLRRNTLSVEDDARRSNKTETVAEELARAATQQADAVSALRSDQHDPAADSETVALDHLREALALIRQMKDAAEQEQMRKQREQLRQAYQDLARKQVELRGRTEPFAETEKPSRRERALIVRLGHQQEDVRIAAHELAEENETPLLFEHLHTLIDEQAQQVVTQLRGGAARNPVLRHQQRIADVLVLLADALDMQGPEQEFDGPAGGGGGGGGNDAVIPPAAQLKLFRSMQQSIYDRTRRTDENRDADAEQRDHAVTELSAEQDELAGLGEKMIESMRQPMQGHTLDAPLQEDESP